MGAAPSTTAGVEPSQAASHAPVNSRNLPKVNTSAGPLTILRTVRSNNVNRTRITRERGNNLNDNPRTFTKAEVQKMYNENAPYLPRRRGGSRRTNKTKKRSIRKV